MRFSCLPVNMQFTDFLYFSHYNFIRNIHIWHWVKIDRKLSKYCYLKKINNFNIHICCCKLIPIIKGSPKIWPLALINIYFSNLGNSGLICSFPALFTFLKGVSILDTPLSDWIAIPFHWLLRLLLGRIKNYYTAAWGDLQFQIIFWFSTGTFPLS